MIKVGLYGFERGYAYSVFIVEPNQKPAPDGSLIYRVYRKDCTGRGVPWDGSYKRVRTLPPVKRFDDHRRLEDLQAGCCPPELLIDFIDEKGLGASEDDDVKEAYTLHKRGYLGGVG